MPTIDRLWIHGRLATMTGDELGVIEDGAVAAAAGEIVWVGRTDELPDDARSGAHETVDLSGRWVTPGLIDCHTHLVFGGDRADEFEARLRGESYEEIARRGGGILSTVRHTRQADPEHLAHEATPRIVGLMAEGVTTIEIKSGYGLDRESELAMLRAATMLGHRMPVRVERTFLGLHALPEESADGREGFVERMTEEVLPAVIEGELADAADVFCERIAFTVDECRRFLTAASKAGLGLRLHADQLSDGGGAALAAELGALSADHLEYTSAEGARAMGEVGTVAVLLPGAFHFLGETQPPPVEAFRDHGVPMALATDLNPGSSPVGSILTMVNLGCVLFGLTPTEALRGVTVNAARALGRGGEIGTIEPGKRADLAIWEVGHPRDLAYWLGRNPCVGRVFGGFAD